MLRAPCGNESNDIHVLLNKIVTSLFIFSFVYLHNYDIYIYTQTFYTGSSYPLNYCFHVFAVFLYYFRSGRSKTAVHIHIRGLGFKLFSYTKICFLIIKACFISYFCVSLTYILFVIQCIY